MNKLMIKLGAGLATTALLVGSIATSVFAADITISGNGNGSTNGVVVTQTCANTLVQKNKTNVVTFANVSASTGGNSANQNTGGEVSVESGEATSSLTVDVTGGDNSVSEQPSCCDCQGVGGIAITDNGNNSNNGVVLVQANGNTTKQKNKTNVVTAASVKAKTGKNKANKNTGSGVSVVSGPASSSLDVTVTGSTNSL